MGGITFNLDFKILEVKLALCQVGTARWLIVNVKEIKLKI